MVGAMKLEDLVEIGKFTESITPPDRRIFHAWSSTAFEVSRDSFKDIARIRDTYLEIPEAELRPRQIITFIEALLEAMRSDEERRTLIRVEALQFRRHDQL
jgi:predicted HTH domain antitoxin